MEKDSKILVLGHKGMVGSSIIRCLEKNNFSSIIIDDFVPRTDLTNYSQTEKLFYKHKPDYVFLAAAKVGGILANKNNPATFIYNNLSIQSNVIEISRLYNVKKLLFLGSSCIYPKLCKQPIAEEELLSGYLEPTNEYYAIAKIAGIKMCEAYWKEYGCRFISCQPCNLFGPQDNYDKYNSHVLPALIRKFHEAKTNNDKEVVVWGTGSPLREFMYVDDLANACVFLMENYEEKELINVGSGLEISIKDLANLIKKIVEFDGIISFDTSKPDGTPRKIMNNSKIRDMGWEPTVSLTKGIELAYKDFLKEYGDKK